MNRIPMVQLATLLPFSVVPRSFYLLILVIQQRQDIPPMRTALALRVCYQLFSHLTHINTSFLIGSNIPRIPSLPISWSTAQTLLHEINETGQNRAVRLVNRGSYLSLKFCWFLLNISPVDDRVIPIWNTMALIPGHIGTEVVVLGCHRDAWVMGAADPSSGTTSVHEVIRGFGELYQKGWRPLRTILLASWDAEEYGLIGSTEWGEDFHQWIKEHVVAYVNVGACFCFSQVWFDSN